MNKDKKDEKVMIAGTELSQKAAKGLGCFVIVGIIFAVAVAILFGWFTWYLLS